MPHQRVDAVQTTILDLALLLRIKHGPLPIMEFFVEVENEQVMHKVNKGVTDVCSVRVVDW